MTEHPGMEMGPEERTLEAPDKDAKMWAMICHLAAFAFITCIPFANLIGPVIIWLIKRQDHPFIDDQGKESVNFQLSVSIVGVALAILGFIPVVGLITIPVSLLLVVAVIVLVIMGAVAANRGELYRYPVNLRLLK